MDHDATTARPGGPDRSRLAQLERAIARCGAEPRPAARRSAGRGPVVPTVVAASDDEQLVAMARGGDQRAFRELYARHSRAVSVAIRDRVRDPERRAELVQDAFTRAFERLVTLRDPSRFRQWVLQVGRNLAVDEVRRNYVRRIEWVAFDIEAVPAGSGGEPAVAFELRQRVDDVEAAISSLSPRDNHVLAMSARLGLGVGEIARELGVSHGAAKVILHRARRRLLAKIA